MQRTLKRIENKALSVLADGEGKFVKSRRNEQIPFDSKTIPPHTALAETGRSSNFISGLWSGGG
jgi:hypothetical protein